MSLARFNLILAYLTFWVVLWWAIFSARFEGWVAAWPLFALAIALLVVARLLGSLDLDDRLSRAVGRR